MVWEYIRTILFNAHYFMILLLPTTTDHIIY
jgi:hypothetical protein